MINFHNAAGQVIIRNQFRRVPSSRVARRRWQLRGAVHSRYNRTRSEGAFHDRLSSALLYDYCCCCCYAVLGSSFFFFPPLSAAISLPLQLSSAAERGRRAEGGTVTIHPPTLTARRWCRWRRCIGGGRGVASSAAERQSVRSVRSISTCFVCCDYSYYYYYCFLSYFVVRIKHQMLYAFVTRYLSKSSFALSLRYVLLFRTV